jgi:serine/threonine-protein kinase
VPRTARAPRALLLAAAALLAVGAVAAAILLGGGSGGDDRSGASARQERAQRAERRRERQRAAQQQQQGGAYAVPQPGGSSAQEGARLQAEGHRLLESGAATAAVPVLERSVRAFPAGTDALDLQYALFDLGKALRLAGRPADAIPVLELRRRHPNQPDVVQRELDLARAAAGQ